MVPVYFARKVSTKTAASFSLKPNCSPKALAPMP